MASGEDSQASDSQSTSISAGRDVHVEGDLNIVQSSPPPTAPTAAGPARTKTPRRTGRTSGFTQSQKVLIIVAVIGALGTVLAALIARPWTWAEPAPACPYAAAGDAETFINLIQAESDAVNTADLEVIHKIFAPTAQIRDEISGQTWNSPAAHYAELFQNGRFNGARHFEPRNVTPGSVIDRADYTTGSEGTFLPAGAAPQPFHNAPGSDHWTFQKIAGCWQIVRFAYNAGAVPFP